MKPIVYFDPNMTEKEIGFYAERLGFDHTLIPNTMMVHTGDDNSTLLRERCVSLANEHFSSKNGSIPNEDVVSLARRIYSFITENKE